MNQKHAWTMEEILQVGNALQKREGVRFWPPETLRVSVRGCNDGSSIGYHWEGIARLPGDVIAHIHDPEHYPSVVVALAMAQQFAETVGVEWRVVEHGHFEHSGEPELEGRS